jgi:hypothetical protein
MKATIISACAAALVSAVTIAQNPVSPVPAGRGAPADGRPIPPANTPAGGSDERRFNLRFPGGKVREFVDAVAKAVGSPVNVIIPKDTESTMIPPVDVYGVTVSALFRALSDASNREIVVQNTRVPSQNEVRQIGFNFASQDQNSSEPVWTFHVTTPPEFSSGQPNAPERLVQFYPVAEYLTHFTVEDITTAIESGWQLQGDESAKASPPILRFHEETKLLICAGSNSQLGIIPQVLAGLSQLLAYPRTDHLKITRKAKEIVAPKVQFREASVQEAIDFIRRVASENDPEKKGINILLNEVNGPADQKVTLSLSEIPVLEVLRFIAELANLDFQIRDTAIVLSTGGTANSSDARPHAGAPAAPIIPGQTNSPDFGVRR